MSDPSEKEIRLRCIEAAAKSPIVHQKGPAAGVLDVAAAWSNWIIKGQKPGTLGLPDKS